MAGGFVGGWLVLVVTATAGASDIGVVPRRLVVVDRLASTGTARTIFVARDAAVANGPATEGEQVRARLHVQYGDGAAAGAFVIPAGRRSGWVRDDPAVTMYRNRDAPGGVTQMRSIVVRPGRLEKLRGAGLGDIPLDIVGAGAPTGSVYVSLEIVEAGMTTRLCSEVRNCTYRGIQGGTGAKLTCRGGVADPRCRAAHPVYVSGRNARYGGAGTVAVVGDSITAQASGALQEVLAERWFVHVRAQPGAMFRELQQASETIAHSDPQVAVINLGTNDTGCYVVNMLPPGARCRYPDFDLDDLLADARAMVASVAGACVIGTTTWYGNTIGRLWFDMAAKGELAGVVSWREHLASLSADERSLLLADQLGHLTAAGKLALAEMTAHVVDQSCGG